MTSRRRSPATGGLIRMRRRQQGDDRLDLRGRPHRLAFVLPLQHQPVTRRAATVLGRRCAPARQANRRLIAVTSHLGVQNPELPFPKIQPSPRVEKCLPRPQLKIPQGCPVCLRPSEKAGVFLAVNVEAETEAIPAEKATKDLVETCEVQVIRYSQDPDYHGAHFAQYC